MPTVEDYFDDDTDLPLPSSSKPRALPHTGERGALLEEIAGGDDMEMDYDRLAEQGRGIFGEDSVAPPPSGNGKGKMTMRDAPSDVQRPGGGGPNINPNTPMGGFMGDMMKLQQAEEDRMEKLKKQFGSASMADPSVYKSWNSVYPLYFDAKVSVGDGRRVPRSDAVWWPQATQISHACRSLGLPSVLEPDRCHPADWENPGRVKVQFVKDGRFLNPIVKNRTQLYKHLSSQIRQQNPSIVFTKSEPKAKAKTPASAEQRKTRKRSGKAAASASAPALTRSLPSRPAPPPAPIPSLDDRLPLHSPLHPAGVAVAAIKRDLDNEKEMKKKGLGAPPEEGAKEKQPKIKRMVVRGKR